MKEKIYITLPKNISLSVFEALKLHESLFNKLDKEVIYLSRSKEIQGENVVGINSFYKTIKYLRKQNKGVIYCITVNEVLLAALSNIFIKKKEVIFWVQGLIDDEDYLSRNSKLRYYTFNGLFKFSLYISTKLVVVTNYMFEVLKTTYNCPKNKPYIVIPCKSRVKYNGDKKIRNSLCYIGGLAKWQNVDIVLKFYNELNVLTNQYKLYIATFNHIEANELIEQNVNKKYHKNITLVNVSTAAEVEAFLSTMEYGFLIRDNIPLNNVASPIKLAEYLSCGVTLIISKGLTEFYYELNKLDCGIFIENDYNEATSKLLAYKPSLDEVIKSYKIIYKPKDFIRQFKGFLNQ